ncbi:MAG: polyprenyl synthetase family protein [Wenzhouxiangellaceae bacterium]|nr:polyprenyl synthetase family protein [Wenzhouxiangellaceae bacterium]
MESTLEAWLGDPGQEPKTLNAAMHYAVFNGGKRIRPLLCFAAAEALDLEPGRVDPMAAAVELIHCYSLVHDDLPAMDDDDLRRGKPTIHRAFDEATAILAGDALQTLAFGGLAQTAAPLGAIEELARASGSRGMAGGQAMDLAFEATRPGREQLETMFQMKTGALIRAAVVMPATLLHPPEDPVRKALIEYAESIGLAFQIVDDLLDIEGSTDEIGKPSGSDARQNKATWPMLFGIDAARERSDQLMETANAALARIPGNTEGLAWLGSRIVNRSS